MRIRLLLASLFAGGFLLFLGAPPAAAHFGQNQQSPVLAIILGLTGLAGIIIGATLSSRGARQSGLAVFMVGVLAIALGGADLAFDASRSPVSSPTKVVILEPKPGAKVSSPVKIKVELIDGVLVPLDQTTGPPTEGHLHFFVNGRLVDMASSLEQELELEPGTYLLQIEFTGADHNSFDPFVQAITEFEVLPK